MTESLRLHGNSGHRLEVVQAPNGTVQVRKYSSHGLQNGSRLQKQAEKQRAFHKEACVPMVRTAQVHSIETDELGTCCVTMEFLPFIDFVGFVPTAAVSDLAWVQQKVVLICSNFK